MPGGTSLVFTILFLTVFSNAFSPVDHARTFGPQGVNLWKLDKHHTGTAQNALEKPSGTGKTLKSDEFPLQLFKQPLDHFDKDSKYTFDQRYWVSTRHYKPRKGAPVIVLDGGETSAEGRLPYLDTGIVEILARATGGVGVILEHRYYGKSIPVSNLSTDSLRFLNNDQAAADSANFMRNVKFDGIAEDLTAPSTPWIYYGGSYAGARAAHMKILYPDIVWGAIASSAVTHASLEDWQYMDVIRKAANSTCTDHLVNSINTIDSILLNGPTPIKRQLKSVFGLEGLEHDDDFVSVLENPLEYWQAKNWNPKVGSTTFDTFCDSLETPFGTVTSSSLHLPYEDPERMVDVGEGLSLDISVFNYGKWIKKEVVSSCPPESSIEDCFGTYNDEQYLGTGLDQDWRLWLFQVCTQWGFFTTAPPDPKTPRIISKLLTLGYQSKICKQAFPPGKYFTVPPLPDIASVNALGDFGIAADRLAIIDGEVDPWRPNTPHSDDAEDRDDTILRPFKLIPNGVHHYDENGLANPLDEPPEIRKIHAEMIDFVGSWLRDWNVEHGIEA